MQWFDFEQKPKANMNFGEKLDLTGTVLKVHLADGQTKTVPFDKISEYGITTNIEMVRSLRKIHRVSTSMVPCRCNSARMMA